MLTFADLKSYRFTYWYGSPVLVPSIPFRTKSESHKFLKQYNSNVVLSIYRKIQTYLIHNNDENIHNRMVFMLIKSESQNSYEVVSLKQGWNMRYNKNAFIGILDSSSRTYTTNSNKNTNTTTLSSSSSLPWSMRNLLALLAYHVPPSNNNNNASSDPSIYCNIISVKGSILKHFMNSNITSTTDNFSDEEICKSPRFSFIKKY